MVAVTTAEWSGVTPTDGRDDVDLVLGDDLGDVGQQARPVIGLDPDGDRVGLGRRRLPFDLDEPAHLTLVGHGRTALKVDGHALAAGDEPTIGSPGIGWQHLANRTRRSPTPLTRTPPVRATWWAGATVGSWPWPSSTTPRRMTTVCGADGAVADRRVEVVDRLVVVLAGDLGQLVRADRGE